MARKKKHEEHENLERWLVSYADFITLLFAFFTVLYATSATDSDKLEAVIDSLNAAFDQLPLAIFDVLTPGIAKYNLTGTQLTMEEASDPTILSLKRNLAGSLSDNVVQIGLVEQSLTLVIPEKLLFAPGSADLHPAAYMVLAEIANVVKDTTAQVQVIGHTDSTPVGADSPFIDNWGLATARAAATVRYLQSRSVSSQQLLASGQVKDADTHEARSVTIQIHMDEPGTAADVATDLEPQLDMH